jgi:ribosome biogenesis GTPase / thiamine phosphate phosphatase
LFYDLKLIPFIFNKCFKFLINKKIVLKKGLVLTSAGSWYTVKSEEGKKYSCAIRGKLRVKGIKSTNPVTVGDYVEFEEEEPGIGVITKILNRKNYIIRKSINLSKQVHILASNIDYVLLMASIKHPETTTMFIDRVLLTAEAYRIPAIILFNKVDMLSKDELDVLDGYEYIYELAGYKTIRTSTVTGLNIDEVQKILKDKVCMITGHSGVGKSSIINKIDAQLNIKTTEISDSYKTGKHTTTNSEMHELPFGGYIIDTPGIKAFGIIDIEKNELFHFFPEIFRESKNCQYYNCTHTHEPKCAVKEAVKQGIVHEMRYYNYLEIYFDEGEKYRKPH